LKRNKTIVVSSQSDLRQYWDDEQHCYRFDGDVVFSFPVEIQPRTWESVDRKGSGTIQGGGFDFCLLCGLATCRLKVPAEKVKNDVPC